MRQAIPADAEAIHAVVHARELADVGRPDWTLADARAALAKPGADGVVVTDDTDAVVAFGLLNGIDATVAVHPSAEGKGIGTLLRGEVERRASGPVLRQEVMSANEGAVGLLTTAGYEHEQHYWRMERELSPDEPGPAWPPGVGARALERDGDDRAVYELIAGAMREIPGNTERSFEEWSARALTDALAPDLSTVAGDMAGVALCQRHPGGEGYVDYVAVARDWRGRGLGRALLQESFRRFAAEGMTWAVLWVNGANESATRLYRGVGMEVAFSADRLVKRL
jgi:ribosomal protein S18 acetylase RimI-like enzyme